MTNSPEYDRQYYKNSNKAKKIRQVAERKQRLYKRLSDLKAAVGCSRCPEREACALDFHHLGGKLYTISHMVQIGLGWAKIEAEIKKCIILCANCHRKETYGNKVR